MGDFLYSLNENKKGEHSITINGMNTWDMWHMAPKSRPFVAAPQVKTEYVDVPGADGSLDYTEVLTGKPRYANRTGQWEFIIDNFGQEWYSLYSEILTKLHGKYFDEIVLEDDPDYKWKGRLTVTGQFGNKDYSSVTIAYNLDPYKRPIESAEPKNWKWRELFGNTIYYGSFTVNGIKTHNIINDSESGQTAIFNSTSAMKFYRCTDDDMLLDMLTKNFSGYTPTWLASGDNNVNVPIGTNTLVFVGHGIVKITYERGKSL